MSELCNCIFFSLSLGGRKEKRIRTRLNETAQSRSASEAKVNKPRSLFYITAPWLLQQPCLCCLPPHFCFQPAARLSSAFTPPKASSPHLNSTSRHRRRKQLWRQTELWWVSFSELPVLTIPNGAGKSSCVTIPIQTCWDSLSCHVLISTPSWEAPPLSTGDLLCTSVCTFLLASTD